MFWQFGFSTVSPVDTLLGKEGGCTLAELLAEDDLIQECKSLNTKLVEYLAQPDVTRQLVRYLVDEPPADTTEELKFKFPYLAYEIFYCEVTEIVDTVVDDAELLRTFVAFLDK